MTLTGPKFCWKAISYQEKIDFLNIRYRSLQYFNLVYVQKLIFFAITRSNFAITCSNFFFLFYFHYLLSCIFFVAATKRIGYLRALVSHTFVFVYMQ